jgi:hypothetical protein
MYLDMNTPFPEITVTEMVDGILSGKYLTEKTSEAKFLFRDYGVTAEEVIGTLIVAASILEDENPSLSKEVDTISKMLSKLWEI